MSTGSPTPAPKKLRLDVDLDPSVTSDELADPQDGQEKQRMASLLEDVPPHHGS